MKNELEQLERLDTDKATMLGLWFGVGGFFVGVIGIGLTIYTLFASQPNIFWLTLSGWLAALLTAFSLGHVANKLLKLIGSQGQKLQSCAQELKHLQTENARLIEIDAFIVAKSLRTTGTRAMAPKKEAGVAKEVGGGNVNNAAKGEGSEN